MLFTPVRRTRWGLAALVAILMATLLLHTPEPVFASGATADGSDVAGPRVLASTAWTAAIAQAAGADQVDILASFELRHPPERDFRPSDVTRAVAADYIVFAGYEAFMHQLIGAAGIPSDKVIQFVTQNTPDHLVQLTRELAARWGTTARQQAWEAEFLAVTDAIAQAAAAAHTENVRVVSVGHMLPFLSWLGYDIVDSFGFEELTPTRIHAMRNQEPDLVVDVWHNPTGAPLSEGTGADYVLLINFPGHNNTRSLIDVFRHNAAQLGLDVSLAGDGASGSNE